MAKRRPSPLFTWFAPVVACLTLGLAPFSPEPHIVGKLRWVSTGAHGMAPLDGFDLVFHGAPWVWLFTVAALSAVRRVHPAAGRRTAAALVLAVLGAVACVLYAWRTVSGA